MFRFQTFTGVSHAISTRHGGVSPAPYDSLNVGYGTPDDEDNVASNRRLLFDAMGVEARDAVAGFLTHGSEVSVFQRCHLDEFPVERLPVREGSRRKEPFFRADGVVSNVPGLHVLLTCADCVPLLFHDAQKGVIGAAHAGWRGTAAGIAPAVVGTMVQVFGSNPADIRVGIGPSVGPCCYAIGPGVLRTFGERGTAAALETRDGSLFLDLWATNERQLLGAGVELIERARICTACHTETYFSHRGEAGRTGRFALIAGLGPVAQPA